MWATARVPLIRETGSIRVLVFDPELEDRARLASELRRSGHEPVVAEDLDAACRALSHQRIDVSIVGVRPDGVAALEALRQASPSTHIIAVGRELCDSDIDAVYDAGADSDVRGASDAQRLLARIQAVLRRNDRTAPPVSMGVPVVTDGPADLVLASTAWRYAASLLQIATSQTLALPVAIGNPARIRAPLAHGSVIELASAEAGIELAIAVAADQRAAKTIAMHVLGSDHEGPATDVLNELANVFMGVLKRSLGDEGLDFTGGIPMARPDPLFVDASWLCAAHSSTFALFVHDAPLLVRLTVRSNINACVGLGELREGLLLAQDIYSGRGVLLLESGTRLSRYAVDRLRTVLTPTTELEVIR